MTLSILASLPPAISIAIIAIAASTLVTIIYKYTTNQRALKELKESTKTLREQIKTAAGKQNAAEMQKKMMENTFKQFSYTTKAMLLTFIPLILVFTWVRGSMGYEPIRPGQEFTTTVQFSTASAAEKNISLEAAEGITVIKEEDEQDKDKWVLKADKEGLYELSYRYNEELYKRKIAVTSKFSYENPVLDKKAGGFLGIGAEKQTIKPNSEIERITVDLQPLHPFGSLTILGWVPGWLATYIFFSIIASMLTRKIFKVH